MKNKIVQIAINPGGGALALSRDGKVWMARGTYWKEIWPDSEKLNALHAENDKRPLATCELTVRAQNVCINLGLITLGDLAAVSEQTVLQQKNAGRKTLKELRDLLDSHGFQFRKKGTE